MTTVGNGANVTSMSFWLVEGVGDGAKFGRSVVGIIGADGAGKGVATILLLVSNWSSVGSNVMLTMTPPSVKLVSVIL